MGLHERLRAHPAEIAGHIEHTNVEPDASVDAIDSLCTAVRDRGFRSAVVLPYHVERAHDHLEGVADVVTVVGFPYGIQPTPAKVAEANAVMPFVDEVDMVMNRTAFANDDLAAVADDVSAVADAIGDRVLKCIIETPLLEVEEIVRAATIVTQAGAGFVKTAVGYEGAVDPDEVAVIADAVDDDVGIKASGGIGEFDSAMAMVEAGATRIGASAGEAILESVPT